MFSLTISDDVAQRLQKRAAELHVTVDQLITQLLGIPANDGTAASVRHSPQSLSTNGKRNSMPGWRTWTLAQTATRPVLRRTIAGRASTKGAENEHRSGCLSGRLASPSPRKPWFYRSNQARFRPSRDRHRWLHHRRRPGQALRSRPGDAGLAHQAAGRRWAAQTLPPHSLGIRSNSVNKPHVDWFCQRSANCITALSCSAVSIELGRRRRTRAMAFLPDIP